jgi:hypothetical protein
MATPWCDNHKNLHRIKNRRNRTELNIVKTKKVLCFLPILPSGFRLPFRNVMGIIFGTERARLFKPERFFVTGEHPDDQPAVLSQSLFILR